MDLFLLYLISKFSLKKPEHQIHDRVLNRKVAFLVFIENSKLTTKEIMLGKTPIQLKDLARQNEKTIQVLVKSDSIPPRIESIAYEYMIKDFDN